MPETQKLKSILDKHTSFNQNLEDLINQHKKLTLDYETAFAFGTAGDVVMSFLNQIANDLDNAYSKSFDLEKCAAQSYEEEMSQTGNSKNLAFK